MDYFRLVVFPTECVVRGTVSQAFACVLMTYVLTSFKMKSLKM